MTSYRKTTQAIRVGQYVPVDDVHGEPIAYSSAFVFASAADAAARFSGATRGNVYARFTNPTVQAFEARLAALEGAEDAVAFASGMAAIAALGFAWLRAGENIVCSRQLFGTTLHAFRHYFGRFAVDVRAVDLVDSAAWCAAIDARTRLVFFETPANPVQQVADIGRIAALAHAAGALVVVDNTLLTPLSQQPLAHGADLVVHSAGKYLDGQGRCVGGIVAGSERLTRPLRDVLRALGSTLSAMNAWLLLKSLETLDVRLQRAQATAHALAQWWRQTLPDAAVHYTGLVDHPQHALACRQQSGFGAVLSVEVPAGRRGAWRFIDALRLVSIATNIGDTRTMVTHPASTTHGRLAEEERRACGIGEGLVRFSVGLEDVDDLRDDMARALAHARDCAPVAA